MHSPSPPLSPAVIVLLFFRNPTLHPLFFLLLPCFPLTLTLPSTTLGRETLSPAAALAPAIERRRERESKRTAREHSESRERENSSSCLSTGERERDSESEENKRSKRRSQRQQAIRTALSVSLSLSICLPGVDRSRDAGQTDAGRMQTERERARGSARLQLSPLNSLPQHLLTRLPSRQQETKCRPCYRE